MEFLELRQAPRILYVSLSLSLTFMSRSGSIQIVYLLMFNDANNLWKINKTDCKLYFRIEFIFIKSLNL